MFSFRGSSGMSESRLAPILRNSLRFLQFVFAITAIGLYGTDLDSNRKVDGYESGEWIYAVIVGSLAAITSLVYLVPLIKSWIFFGWDFVLFILWVAVFGLFASTYLDAEPDRFGIRRMKSAVWIDLINMLLWLVSTLYGGIAFVRSRRQRTLHTSRAFA